MSEKLLSRKFWLALAACVFFAFNGAMEQIATCVVAYLAIQGGVDAFASYTSSKSESE